MRVDNSKFASDLISKANELNELYNNINSIKDYILKEFNNKSEEFYKKTEETNKSFEEYKISSIINVNHLTSSNFINSYIINKLSSVKYHSIGERREKGSKSNPMLNPIF